MRRTWIGLVCGAMLGLGSVAVAADKQDASKLYDVAFEATSKVAKGQQGTVRLRITPKNGAELHKEAPISLALKGPENVSLSKARVGRAELKMDGHNGSFEVPFTASTAGKGAIDGNLSFYICTEKICERQVRQFSAPVEVQ